MPRQISEQGKNLIKKYEGLRLEAYKASPNEKYWTIGWGHNGADVAQGRKISQEEADRLFDNDVQKFVNAVNNAHFGFTPNQSQFDALCSFCYNLGPGRLADFRGKSAETVAREMLLYNKAGGRVLQGLVNRRQEEVALFNSGDGRKSVVEVAREVIAGNWGNGELRKTQLINAGYDYVAVQKEVNRQLGIK